ncbi:peptidylprolyl isomerase [Halioxenophilus sp. WMMB6]|uniref:peptidylprolyl isomerase n=1 Tax=Halioxenophilus sp. WMMB6 TaxID=3073815 RepID=UPI00295E653E|nr:peptidylprolyl isomerase [Halioxenophilus sp. WMMB6]
MISLRKLLPTLLPSRQVSTRSRRLLAALSLAGLIGAPLVGQAKIEDLDHVVAVVDEDVVMASELDHQLAQVRNQIKSRGSLPPDDVLREQVLEHLIVQRLQLSLAERMGMDVTDAEIDQTVERMRASNKLGPDQFLAKLAEDGLTLDALRQQLRDELLVQKVQQARVYYRIQITDQEVDNFLNSEEGKFWLSPEYDLGHILVAFSGNGRGEDLTNTQARAQTIYRELQKGGDFQALAVSHSSGQNALQGGALGWRKAVELPTLFSEQLDGKGVGDVTEPFKSGAGFHILKIYNRRGAEQTVVPQAKVRHILIKPSEILSDEQAYNKLIDLRQQVLDGADFSALAKENSEDIGSMLAGGDLGWSLPGKFVPEFEQVLEQTKVGEVSQPFRSQFGWHILTVDDRRNENMTDTVIRNQAINLLRSRRFNEELDIWLQELRSQAYVETKLR